MKNVYVPVQSHTFVNASRRTFRTLRIALHNAPVVTQIWGSLDGHGRFARKLYAESREQARDYVENKIAQLVDNGFVQVA